MSATRQPAQQSTLVRLRRLVPNEVHSRDELLTVIERQADTLRALGPDPIATIMAVPSIRIEPTTLHLLGLTYWDGDQWVVGICPTEPEARRRFTLLHEFAHILWHPAEDVLFGSNQTADLQELAADYFAGLVLTPTARLRQACRAGLGRPDVLERIFQVSEHSIAIRLAQTGLGPDVPGANYLKPSRTKYLTERRHV